MPSKRKSFIFRSDDNEVMRWIVDNTGSTQTDILRISIRLLRDAILFDSLGKYENFFSGERKINELDDMVSCDTNK